MRYLLIITAALFYACGQSVVPRDCVDLPESKINDAAKNLIQCVEAATAKTTGENQDAEDWVYACKSSALELFGKRGQKKVMMDGGSTLYDVSGCVPFDSASGQVKTIWKDGKP